MKCSFAAVFAIAGVLLAAGGSGCKPLASWSKPGPSIFKADRTAPGTLCTFEVVPPADRAGENVSDLRDAACAVLDKRFGEFFPRRKTSVVAVGENRLAVRLPGLTPEGLELALDTLQRRALLEFRVVHPQNDKMIRELFENRKVPAGYEIASPPGVMDDGEYWCRTGGKKLSPEALAAVRRFEPVFGYELLLERRNIQGGDYYMPWYASTHAELTGGDIKSAGTTYTRQGWNVVELSFDTRGRKVFAQLTADLAPGGAQNPDPTGRRYLAIVMDGTIHSAPFIRTSIPGGHAVIEGHFTPEEAHILASLLCSGPLPCPLSLVETQPLAAKGH